MWVDLAQPSTLAGFTPDLGRTIQKHQSWEDFVERTIDQFMWGFQPQFRVGVEDDVQRALALIGLPVEVRVLQVGFALDAGARHQVCVEPEHGPLAVDRLAAVPARAAELYEADPESQLIHTDLRSHELHHQQTFRRARANAVVEVIESSGAFGGLRFFASQAAPIGGYEVHTCVGVPAAVIDALPAFPESVVDRLYVGRSLQHEVVTECLERADRALYLPDPGAGIFVLGASGEEVVKSAADGFTRGTVCRATGMPADLFSLVNEFTSLSYERTGAVGRFIIVNRERVVGELPVRFEQRIRLGDARIMRKLLELSDDFMSVLADRGGVYGLGSCDSGPDVIEISVHGRAEWELSIDGSTFLRVVSGHAMLPRPILDYAKFKDTAERTVGSIELDRIWAVIQRAQATGHGTTLVVSRDPASEVARLGREAVPIEPDCLEPDDIVRLGRVDGAVVLGPDGSCHAFGVILDGKASGGGDPARGSRFNSAVRYQSTGVVPSMVVVISDDGTVDLIPDLRPRVRREDVEAAVSALRDCCQAERVDSEAFWRAYERIKRFAFYLDAAQCQLVNELHEKEMERRWEEHGMRVNTTPLKPHPEMDESYFRESEGGVGCG